MDAVQNTLKAVHLRPDGVMIRVAAVPGWEIQTQQRVDGRRRWKGGNLVRLSPVHGEQGGVLRRNDGTDGEMAGAALRRRSRQTSGGCRIADGGSRPTGQPGEVSQTDLNNGLLNTLNQTSANTNNVETLDSPFADPDMEAMRQKLNEMILNGRR